MTRILPYKTGECDSCSHFESNAKANEISDVGRCRHPVGPTNAHTSRGRKLRVLALTKIVSSGMTCDHYERASPEIPTPEP